MKLNIKEFIDRIKAETKDLNINLTDDALELLYEYMHEVQIVNEVMNLTAISDDVEFVIKHFVDSLYLIEEIEKYIQDKKDTINIIDVGTGAGFPGAVIAIYYNKNLKVNVTLLDALRKRTDFLTNTKNKIGLNYKIVNERSEDFAKNNGREKYDIVVTRAVSRLNILSEITIPLLKINGLSLYMKSSEVLEEIQEAKNAISLLGAKRIGIKEYNLNYMNQEFFRNIVIIKKEKITSDLYPRYYSKIKKQPL